MPSPLSGFASLRVGRLRRPPCVRVTSGEFHALELRANALLAGVPLHDVWRLDLPGGRPGLGIVELRERLASERLRDASPLVRILFGLRAWLGRVFGWDREPPPGSGASFLGRLSPEDRKRSLVTPGTREGRFQVLFVSPREAISEIRNATVHAFSVFALLEEPSAYRLYWAIYVLPVGRITGWYMRLIDPFRRAFVYPAVLRRIRAAWERVPADTPRRAW